MRAVYWSIDIRLAEHLPLEQGLRLVVVLPLPQVPATRRASSIRTRIKTVGTSIGSPFLSPRRASSIKTRMLRREVGTNKKRRLLCQQAPLVGTRLALTGTDARAVRPYKGLLVELLVSI